VAEHTSWVLSWTTKVDEEEGKEKQSKAKRGLLITMPPRQTFGRCYSALHRARKKKRKRIRKQNDIPGMDTYLVLRR
jgi:hypothetical protein